MNLLECDFQKILKGNSVDEEMSGEYKVAKLNLIQRKFKKIKVVVGVIFYKYK